MANGINLVRYIIYREIKVTAVVQIRGYALTLAVESRDVEDIANM